MFTGMTAERVAAMTSQEKRWLDNARKAFHDSDVLYQSGRPMDGSIQLLCIAIELAMKLRTSLAGGIASTTQSRKKFVAFVDTDIPRPEDGGLAIDIEVWDDASKQLVPMSFARLLYEIRCAYAHEYENLDAAESCGHFIGIDWSDSLRPLFGRMDAENHVVVDGPQLWRRLRELVAKFLTGIAGYESLATTNSFSITVAPPLGAIRNARRS
jgi:hypothetical protein